MDSVQLEQVLRGAVLVVIKLAGPLLLVSMVVGVLIAIFQAVTQIHEQTIGFVLKLIVIVIMLLVFGGWMLETLLEYVYGLFELMKG